MPAERKKTIHAWLLGIFIYKNPAFQNGITTIKHEATGWVLSTYNNK
jgi:hypothetical protein